MTSIPNNRIGVCSWSLQPSDIQSLLQALGRLKVDVVQLALVPLVMEPSKWDGALEKLRDSGIRIASGMLEGVGEDYSTLASIKATGGVVPDVSWPKTRERALQVANLAGKAGIGLVTAHAGFIPHQHTDPARQKVLDRVGELADIFAASGVRLGLETGQESAATLLDALEALGHANVGVNFDPANMILYGMGDPVEAITVLKDTVVQVHAKDAIASTSPGEWGSEVPLGSGEVDWDAFLQVVVEFDPALDVVIEREAGEQREVDITVAQSRLLGKTVASN